MSRKREISNDIWDIFCKVYHITDVERKSDKQKELLDKIIEYIDTNLSTRRKRPEKIKELPCLKE